MSSPLLVNCIYMTVGLSPGESGKDVGPGMVLIARVDAESNEIIFK